MKRTEKAGLVVGISGIMGAGKSTVAKVFEDLGAKMIDADLVGRELLHDSKIKQAITEPYYDLLADYWRMPPFRIEAYDLLGIGTNGGLDVAPPIP